jgi:hypothetical protein
MVCFTSSIFGLVPNSMVKSLCRRTCSRSCVTSLTSRCLSITFAIRTSSSLGSNGLAM